MVLMQELKNLQKRPQHDCFGTVQPSEDSGHKHSGCPKSSAESVALAEHVQEGLVNGVDGLGGGPPEEGCKRKGREGEGRGVDTT